MRRYGSDELLAWFEEHDRPTSAYFAKHDTRLAYANTGIRQRITSWEACWRDHYRRAAYNIDHERAAWLCKTGRIGTTKGRTEYACSP